jgi:acyl-CoA synthetase (AMP-forming)/AMP-acid ligase II
VRFDFDRIRAQLETPGADEALPGASDWLSASWHKPAQFWRELTQYHARLSSPAPKSHPSEGFDFYYDLVLRHRPELAALRSYTRQGGWRTLTYGELDARSTALAHEWTARGLAAGAGVCLVLPVGEELMVALMTALRLGLVISYLPPQGAAFIARRIEALKPEQIVTSRVYLSLVGNAKTLLLADGFAAPSAARRLLYTYAPDATVGQLFSEHVDPPHRPLPLRAEELYLGALRDGLLMLGLRPGDLFAAAGLPPLQHQPSLLLSVLMCGATYVHVDPEALALEPSLLANLPLRSVGLSAAERDRLLRSHVAGTRGWGHWFRNPEEAMDWDAWRRFIRQLKLEGVATSNLLVDAAAGGSVLFSQRRRGQVHAEVLPAAGRPWSLRSLGGAGDGTSDGDVGAPAALGDFGLLAGRAPDRPPYVILVRSGSEFLYGGTRTPRSGGRVYPTREVIAAVANTPAIAGATIILDRASRLGQPVRVLVAFTGAQRLGKPYARALTDKIAQALGPELVPEHIQLVPLYPRLRNGQIDQRWCEGEHAMGMLHRKPRQPVYQLLTLLRHAVAATSSKRSS